MFFCSLTAITSLQVAVHLVNVTGLDQVLFSVMSRASVSARTILLARSVTCVSGDSLAFLMPRVKVKDGFLHQMKLMEKKKIGMYKERHHLQFSLSLVILLITVKRHQYFLQDQLVPGRNLYV